MLKLDWAELWIRLFMKHWDVINGFNKALIVSGLAL